MKLKFIMFLLCLASLNVMGQNDNTQGTISRAKCKICGKVISQCKYKGKHPASQPEKTCATCGKVLSKCQYKGKHPKPVLEETCTTCNKPLTQCSYNGKHPEPEAAGYDVTFSCNVPSATLYIDDSSYSNAFGIKFLRTGNHSIKATADGYKDYAASITINRQNTVCVITMEKVPEPEKPVVATTGILNGHEWVDLGLSVKWATCNVGASSPSDYGGYYAWGETTTKSKYDWYNCFDCVKPKKWWKDDNWNVYRLKGKTRISPDSGHDAAKEKWGNSWRMPTIEELRELFDLCKWTYTSLNGKNGFSVEGPNGNHIFIPAAGYQYDDILGCEDESCLYWSCDHSAYWNGHAQYLYAGKETHYLDSQYRCCGLSIRPVTE